jgi:hypothetical protein
MANDEDKGFWRRRRIETVDDAIDDHDRRLSRLEIGAIFVLGYLVADATALGLIEALISFV